MPGVTGQMIVSFFPSGAGTALNANHELGYDGKMVLQPGRRTSRVIPGDQAAGGRLDRRENHAAAKDAGDLAEFVQQDIRYVGIELGIGGFQPHPAPDVFSHRYGDCKDKATLVRTMLREIGVDSYYVLINATRGPLPATCRPTTDLTMRSLPSNCPMD